MTPNYERLIYFSIALLKAEHKHNLKQSKPSKSALLKAKVNFKNEVLKQIQTDLFNGDH